ncbi:vitelline membrane outer layer protein 1-like [Mercenaria mercenaria]|uniref:vitelline membrane outer layer protein 1-like n=1 Tax=Mercenaria mercenaria TaxID=6596 RepID=UPI00234F5F08|nr:vitelline membrane outer layer protein 1-like [Mercenaria mercenaria]
MASILYVIVFLVFVATSGTFSVSVSKTLSVTNANDWGDWGDAQYCGEDTYAVGYDMKIEEWIKGDDTALNGIKLICQSPFGHTSRRGVATSSVGPWGGWVGEALCDNRNDKQQFLTSFNLQSEQKQGKGDDTSANFIKFKCRDLAGSLPSYEMSRDPGFGEWGQYGSWSSECYKGTAICGIKTRVEVPQGRGDDTALNDVIFYCCR